MRSTAPVTPGVTTRTWPADRADVDVVCTSNETADSTVKSVKEKLATRFKELDTLFATQEYLAGDYSVADAYAFTIINWSNFLALPLTAYPNLKAYLARVSARPAAQAALRVEGLIK